MPATFVSRLLTGRARVGVYLFTMNLLLLGILFPLVSYSFLSKTARFRDAQMEQTVRQMRADLRRRGESMARSLAVSTSQAVAGFDYSFLNILMRQVSRRDPELLYCIAMDPNRMAIAHSDATRRGTVLDDPLARRAARFLASLAGQRNPAATVNFVEGAFRQGESEVPVLEVVVPFYNGARLGGVVRSGYSLAGLERQIDQAKREWAAQIHDLRLSLLAVSGAALAAGLCIAMLFSRLLLGSINRLSRGVERVSRGDLASTINPARVFGAEFRQWAGTFNDMTAELRRSYKALEEYSHSLEEKVAARTRELEQAQEELVRQAHEAGMAEMAVGVLHNIGNAITPAKVLVSLVLRQLKKSPLRTGLDDVFRQVEAELARPGSLEAGKRQRLAEVVRLLPAGLREEYDRFIDEMERIRAKHEHIESVIGLQMRYARVVSASEEVDANQVINDALQILEEALRNRGVEVERRFGDLPPVAMEQARLLQIFINLIKNAYEAMEAPEIDEKRLTITTAATDRGTRVEVSVKDTGTGFEPQMAERLFRFGFTTKASGSGFGLHSCANYLLANDGTITARSDGPGKGAEFTVTLPAARPSGEGQDA